MSDKAKELAEWALKRADYRAATGDLHDANQLNRIAAELTRLADRVTFLEKRLARTGYCLKHDTWMHPAESCAKE